VLASTLFTVCSSVELTVASVEYQSILWLA
jgi:hypothetical protein